GADEVAQHHVGRRADVLDLDALGAVAAEDVTGPGRGAADGVAARRVEDEHAVGDVTQGGGAVLVRADEVARDDVARRAAVAEHHVAGEVGQRAVAADDVTGPGDGAAEGVCRRAVGDLYAVAEVSKGGGAVHVGADVVALDHVARGAATGDVHAVAGV